MVKKPKRRSKHTPQRTCVGCRQVLPKRSMIRITNGPDGVRVDLTGKAHGRGAYLHDQRSCWLRGINGALDHALRTKLSDQEKKDLMDFMKEHFPDDEMAQAGTEDSSR